MLLKDDKILCIR